MMTRYFLLAIALLAAGCSKSKPKPEPAACTAACEHTLELAMADIDASAAASGDDPKVAEIMAGLKAKAEASRASDLATCQTQCMAGKLNTSCAMAATTIDGAMECTNRSGGQR